MTDLERRVLGRFKTLLAQRLPAPLVILFGSRARGDATADSDLDVAIVLDGPVTARARSLASECAWEAGFEDGIVVVPFLLSREQWEARPQLQSLFVRGIKADGVAA